MNPLPLVTLKVASLLLKKLRNFSVRPRVGVKVFEALFTLESNIEKMKPSSMK